MSNADPMMRAYQRAVRSRGFTDNYHSATAFDAGWLAALEYRVDTHLRNSAGGDSFVMAGATATIGLMLLAAYFGAQYTTTQPLAPQAWMMVPVGLTLLVTSVWLSRRYKKNADAGTHLFQDKWGPEKS